MYQLLGASIHVSGELLVAYTVLRVHHRVLHERKMDKKVFRAMRKEQVIGLIGALLILSGFLIEVFS